MKMNYFKILPAALAILALSSCNSDDFFGLDNLDGKKTMVVNIAEPETDEDFTRSSFYGSNQRIFNAADQLRAYDAQLQKFDVYTYQTADKFTTEDPVLEGTPSYMLFPANMVNYGAWKKNVGMFALMKLADDHGVLTYGEETRTIGGNDVTAYLSNIPEFGAVTAMEDGALQANAVYLTGMLKIKIENGASNVLAIRVSSLTSGGVANETLPLWGYFDAKLDAESALTAAANKSKLIPSTEALVPAKTADNAVLVVDLPAGQMKDYTSYVYIPIIPTTTKAENGTTGKYPKLKVEYFDTSGDKNARYPSTELADNGTWKELTTFTDKQIKTNTVYSKKADGTEMKIGGFTLEVNATGLKDINDAIAKYSTLSGKKTIVVKLAGDLSIPAANDGNYVEGAKKILLPQLNDNLTIQIDGASLTTNELVIEDKEGVTAGAGKFTLELITADKTCTKVNSSSAHAIELKTSGDEDTKFAGVEMHNTASELTLNGNFTTIPAEFKATDMKSLVIATDPKLAIVSSVPVTIKSGIDNASGVVAKGGASVIVDKAADGATIKLIDVQAAVTNKVGESADVLVEAGTITKLKLYKDITKLQMTGGTIANLWGDKNDEGKFEPTNNLLISTSGTAVINTVGAYTAGIAAKQLQFKSTWKNTGDIAAAAFTGGKIYTAAQLASIALTSDAELATDIEIVPTPAEGKSTVWASKDLAAKNFDGKNFTIKGLNAPLFKDITGGDDAGHKTTVKNLKLTNVNIATAKNAGALAQTTVTDKFVDFVNITVEGTSIGAAVGPADLQSENVGGLIGKSQATSTITNCSAQIKVQGFTALGGLIGNAAGGALTFVKGANKSNVSFERTVKITGTSKVMQYAEVGNLIGTVSAATDITIGVANDTYAHFFTDNINPTTLEFSKNYTEDGTFAGLDKHEIGYSTNEAGHLSLYGYTHQKSATDRTLQTTGVALTTAYVNYYTK